MRLFALEQDKATQGVDFALYGVASVALICGSLLAGWREPAWQSLALTLGGLAAWTVLEYGLHRFVLHRLPPLRGWHAQHRHRLRGVFDHAPRNAP